MTDVEHHELTRHSGRRLPFGYAALVAMLLLTACSDGNRTTADGAPTSRPLRIVSQNILHGIACAPDSDQCSLPDRLALFVHQLAAADCPEMVGLQEANQQSVALLKQQLSLICDGRYQVRYDDDEGLDREVVLTTDKVLASQRHRLPGPLRTVYVVRLATSAGIVDFVTTHLASGSDDRPCDPTTCPPPCTTTDMLQTCQARQLLELVDRVADPDAVVVIGGDLNAPTENPTIGAIRAHGYRDTHLVAGNPECDAESGTQCTSGRVDTDLSDMTNPASIETERIDYLWIGRGRACRVIAPTGLFNPTPAKNGPADLAFPSDHTGVQATLRCPTTPAQRQATLTPHPLPSTSTTARAAASDATTTDAITTAYSNLFGGEVTDPETKLASLQDAAMLRSSFIASFEKTRSIATRIRVRLDSVTVIDSEHADVIYTLLLDGAAVLDHLPGAAVRQDGRWLVTRRTYCEVSTQGATDIPEPCR